MQIFHIASAAEWADAQASGFYVTSTRGRTLAQEGFIHASRADQWESTLALFYTGVSQPLVLLSIDTDLLTVPWREDPVTFADGRTDTFPHIYGPLNPSAVVAVTDLPPLAAGVTNLSMPTPPVSFRSEMYREIFFRASLVLLVMIGTVIGGSLCDPPLLGAGIGAAIALVVAVVLGRLFTIRQRERLSPKP